MFAPLKAKQSYNFYFTTRKTDFQFFPEVDCFSTKYFAALWEAEVLAPIRRSTHVSPLATEPG